MKTWEKKDENITSFSFALKEGKKAQKNKEIFKNMLTKRNQWSIIKKLLHKKAKKKLSTLKSKQINPLRDQAV